MNEISDIGLRISYIQDSIQNLMDRVSERADDDACEDFYFASFEEQLALLDLDVGILASEVRHAMRLFSQYKDEYTRYRIEYERLVNSGSIKLTLALRRLLGRTYDPARPTELPMNGSLIPLFTGTRDGIKPSAACAAEAKRFSNSWRDKIRGMCESNGAGYFEKLGIKAGIISDEYMYNYYKDACDFELIHPDSYKDQISNGGLDFVIYVSCWKGMRGDEYKGKDGIEKAAEILRSANEAAIPTIFQSIEDPPHFETFLPVAKEANFIFTSDENMVDAYVERTGNGNVWALRYGVNPLLHNPIDFMRQKSGEGSFSKDVVFAGSWYSDFPIRGVDIERAFDGVLDASEHGLIIIDRFSELPPDDKALNIFPMKYDPCIVGFVEHADLQKVHKLFDYAVCANTVKDSETMCAMRVYELQALGSLMLSNYALSVSRAFPSVFVVNDESEVPRILGGYSPREVFSMQVEGIRRMMSGCTVYDRLNEVFGHAGIDARFPDRSIAVVLEGASFDGLRQGRALDVPGAVALSADGLDLDALSRGFDYAIWPTPEALADEHFVDDAVNAFKFVDVDYVAHVGGERFGESYQYVRGTAAPRDTLFALDRVDASRIADPAYLSSLEGFQVCGTLWGRDTGTPDKELALIIPIYNNGLYLRDRCFLSLLRSSAFSRMRVYLMDDGSDDPLTRRAISELCGAYDNVVSFRCGETGSGSASHPRNVGVEVSTEPYVAFIDPDDEAVGDGYARLLDAVEGSGADFAIGDVIALHGPAYEPDRLVSFDRRGVCESPKAELVHQGFTPHNIQACVFRRLFLERSGMSFAVGAFGEDSLYYYEAMLNARSFLYAGDLVFTYYMESEGSATNEIGSEFFEKSLTVEKVQVLVLKEHGMLDAYKDRRLGLFVDNWYKGKLKRVRSEEYGRCAEIISEIVDLYGQDGDAA